MRKSVAFTVSLFAFVLAGASQPVMASTNYTCPQAFTFRWAYSVNFLFPLPSPQSATKTVAHTGRVVPTYNPENGVMSCTIDLGQTFSTGWATSEAGTLCNKPASVSLLSMPGMTVITNRTSPTFSVTQSGLNCTGKALIVRFASGGDKKIPKSCTLVGSGSSAFVRCP